MTETQDSSTTMMDHRETMFKLLNERYPILETIEGQGEQETVRERVAAVRIQDGDLSEMEIETYRGRRFSFSQIETVTVEVHERDGQGAPLQYDVLLRGSQGQHRLRFFA